MNLLINPISMVQDGYTPPPLGLLYLAANDPETKILDLALAWQHGNKIDVETLLMQERPRIVGVPIYTAGRKFSLKILEAAKKAGAITVAGGPHAVIMHKQLMEHYGSFIDMIVLNNNEMWWKWITQPGGPPHAKGMMATLEERDLDKLPIPAWERIPLMQYPARGSGVYHGIDLGRVPRVSIVFGRGCDGKCTFCSTWWVNKKYRHHSIEWITREVSLLAGMGVKHLVWQDDCLTADYTASMQLMIMLAGYGMAHFGSTRVDHMDEELAYFMARAGFYEVSFGIESGSQSMLERMHKETDLSQAFKAREAVRKAGMKFTALMIQGYPHETEKERQETRDFLARLAPDGLGTVGHTMVFPGTALYQECKRAGLINDDFWLGDEPYYIYRGGL